jgi:hypothetical protein
LSGDDHDGIVTHGRSREFRMYIKNPAQTGSPCIRLHDWKVDEATFAEYSCPNRLRGPCRYIYMWQSKREISRECNDIIGSTKGSQISEKNIEAKWAREKGRYLHWSKEEEGQIFFGWCNVDVLIISDTNMYLCLLLANNWGRDCYRPLQVLVYEIAKHHRDVVMFLVY